MRKRVDGDLDTRKGRACVAMAVCYACPFSTWMKYVYWGADVQVQSHTTHSCHAPIFRIPTYCTRDLSILPPRTHLSAEFDEMLCITHMIFTAWAAPGSAQPLGYRIYHSTVTHSYPTCMRAVWGQSNMEFSARHRILAKCHDGDTCRVGADQQFPPPPFRSLDKATCESSSVRGSWRATWTSLQY